MQIGIIGLPQSGKTTVFNALTGSGVKTGAGQPKDIHRAVVKIPDERLTHLAGLVKPKKTTQATIDYLDVTGLGRGKINAESIDAEFLAQLRLVDAVLMVVRYFKDDNVMHPLETIDPRRDVENLNTELVLADLIVIEKRIEKIEKETKRAPNKAYEKEKQLLLKLKALLDNGTPVRSAGLTGDEENQLRGFGFLTRKPLFILVNVAENDLNSAQAILEGFAAYQAIPNTRLLTMAAKIEAEMVLLSDEDAKMFREDLGISEPARSRLIQASYDLLGLVAFFTFNDNECRAWTVKKGTQAHRAAGVIHTDMEKGFIRAEVVAHDDLKAHKDMNGVKQAGKHRLEGKDYIVRDGDILTIRFNV
jgi:GTP-binding protein YchF